jgi:hypothetical protein
MTTKEELAKEWVGRRVEFSGEDEAPNISSLIDKELKAAFLAGYEVGLEEARKSSQDYWKE